ncbi:MAG: hypothetical protein ACAH59_02765 [Pseudobdellovibrionaceae bacterium]
MRILILFFIFISCAWAQAASVLKSGASHFFENGDRSFLSHSVLGPVCSTVRTIRAEPTCNPALLGENQMWSHGVFGANLFFGNDIDTLYKNRDLIAGEDKMKLAQSLLSETEPVSFEASTLIWWRAEKMALSFQPQRMTYFSDVRNQSYPDVAIHGMQEQSLQGQIGGFVSENWRAGLQLRFLDRRFVYEEFNLFEALPTLDEQFQVKNQRAVFVEPGVAYELNQTEDLQQWQPLLSLSASQTGWVDRNYDEIPVEPIVDAGVSISPPIALGEWELGLNYRWTANVSEARKFRWGTLYRLDFIELYAGYDPDEWALGLSANVRALSAGWMYKRTQLGDSAAKAFEDSHFFELRLAF